jgi:hypothetical protein
MSVLNQIENHVTLRVKDLDAYKKSLLSSDLQGITYDSGLTLENKGSWIYRSIHSFIGRILLPVSAHIDDNREKMAGMACEKDHQWDYTPLVLNIDGKKIRAMAVTQKNSVHSGDWVLGIFGRGNSLESRLTDTTRGKNKEEVFCGDQKFRHILSERSSRTNALVFNYADADVSRELAVKATRAAIKLLVDQKNGIGASTVNVYQYSFGAALGYEAIEQESNEAIGQESNEAIGQESNLDAIKSITSDRTFDKLSNVSKGVTGKILAWVFYFFGWDMKPVEIADKLGIKQNIIVAVNEKGERVFDGVIPRKGALAYSVNNEKPNINIIPVKAKHSDFLPQGLFEKTVEGAAVCGKLGESSLTVQAG